MSEQRIRLSGSVQKALESLPEQEPAPAWALVRALSTLHPDYANGLAAKLASDPGPSGGERLLPQEWIEQVYRLYDPARASPLDTRLVIWGLAMLEPTLRQYLDSMGVLELLSDEQARASGLRPEQLLIAPDVTRPTARDVEQARADSISMETEGGPAQVAAWQEVVLLAEAIAAAAATPRPADSLLLLAALLYHGTEKDPSGEAADLLTTLVQTGNIDQALVPEQQILTLLGLRENYGITALSLAPDANLTPGTPHTEELDQTLANARALAEATTPRSQPQERHLLAALLAAFVTPPLAQTYLRRAGHNLPALRQNLLNRIRTRFPTDNQAEWERILLAPDYRPPAPGYISDYVDRSAELKDRLDIEREVATIAHVLIAKRVQPPLALGLFGDWGSGKSFFMTKLQEYVETSANYYRAEERKAGTAAEWCSRVVQIEFNAWHYSDTNLWASLVTRIYDCLDRELSDQRPTDKQLRERLGQQIQLHQGIVREAQAELDQAQARVRAAETTLIEAQADRRQEQERLSGLIGSVQALLAGNEEVRDQLNTAATALGYPEAAKTYSALLELNTNLKSFSGRLAALTVNLLQAPWTLLILAALVIGLPVGISFLLQRFGQQIGQVGQRVTEISVFVFGLIAWLKLHVGRGLKLIGDIETALDEARRIREEQIASNPAVQQAQQALTLAQAKEAAAQNNLQSAQAELQRLQSELEELRPERKLYRLIEERARSAAYSQHLGIITLIRTDFEKISDLLLSMAEEDRNLQEEDPPIQRIILYIDDLDRCRPERVVEVLEAVHMLLAFRLFIVVVGVDPRWLRHSLAHHYAQTLSENGQSVILDGRSGPAYYSTPQDYLEKIFQIPFALRPVEQEGYRKLVADLLEPLPEWRQPTRAAAPQAPPAPSAAGEAAPPTANGAGRPAAVISETRGQPVQPETAGPETRVTRTQPAVRFTPLNPEQLDFKAWEKEDLDRLWPLFRTPRSVKRFVNIYRLLRAGLPSHEDVVCFEGTREQPGEYQQVLLLLAMVTAFPNDATRFLSRLEEWLEAEPDPLGQSKRWHWPDVLAALHGQPHPEPAPVASAGQHDHRRSQTPARATAASENGSASEEAEAERRPADAGGLVDKDVAWELMLARLQQVTSTGFKESFSKATMKQWTMRVARYSFSIQPFVDIG